MKICADCHTEYDQQRGHVCLQSGQHPRQDQLISRDVNAPDFDERHDTEQVRISPSDLEPLADPLLTFDNVPSGLMQPTQPAMASREPDSRAAGVSNGAVAGNFGDTGNRPNSSAEATGQQRSNQAPYLVAGREYTSFENEADETTDMRFHVEKREDPMIGKCVAERYQILSAVGRGGMGTVYKAEHLTIDRLVAIKMLHPHLVSEAESLQRFRHEALAVSKVEHAHSVRIFDFGIAENGQPYLVMDFIEGVSLRSVMKQEGLLSLQRAGAIFEQAIDALECAHRAGVVHKDLKPENIMLGERSGKHDYVSVVDFGISTLVSPRQRVREEPQADTRGSPPYMSPEQCMFNVVVDHRSDIYAISIVLFECLSGRLPYSGRNPIEMMDSHVTGKPMPLKNAHASLATCEALTAILLKAMEKKPENRQQTIQDFGDELKDAIRRDLIRQNSLKNRKQQLDGSTSQITVALDPNNPEHQLQFGDQNVSQTGIMVPPSVSTVTSDTKAREALNPAPNAIPKGAKPNIISRIASFVTGRGYDEEDEERTYTFVTCPHCSEPVEVGIAFCLACGRSLVTIQDFSKVRAAQGVFTLPRSKDTSTSALPAIQMSNKARKLTGGSNMNATNRMLLIICMFLVVAIAGVAGGFQYVSTAISGILRH